MQISQNVTKLLKVKMTSYRYKMDQNVYLHLCVLLIIIPMTKGAIPGTFFWRPRLGLDLGFPTTEVSPYDTHNLIANKANIQDGVVVLIDGYGAGITVLALASGASNAGPYPHFNPTSAHFYTHVYRWALRYISMVPYWLGGNGGNFCETHKTWRRRFYYMDEFVPSWLRNLLFYVKKEEWAKEDLEYKRFKKYAEPAFGKHFRYPNKKFNNFQSYLTTETVDGYEGSSFVE